MGLEVFVARSKLPRMLSRSGISASAGQGSAPLDCTRAAAGHHISTAGLEMGAVFRCIIRRRSSFHVWAC
jgi:hypothetical protein